MSRSSPTLTGCELPSSPRIRKRPRRSSTRSWTPSTKSPRAIGTGANKLLKTELEKYKKKLKDEIKNAKDDLLRLRQEGKRGCSRRRTSGRNPTEEADQAPQPPFNSLTLDQFRSTKDQLLQTELQLLELEARYQSKQAESQQAQARVAEVTHSPQSRRDEKAARRSGLPRSSSTTRKSPP